MSDETTDGLTIAMTPVQMAAVLGDHDVPESASLSNRVWGGLGLVGGVLELVGAGVLCLTPEPTMASKVGCVVLGAHGSDTVATSARQVWTGMPQRSATALSADVAAQAMGASPERGAQIGLAVDVAVPLVVATGLVAARVIAVRGSRIRLEGIRLSEHEAKAGSKVGGHTMREHVGKTDAEMFARLNATPGPHTKFVPKKVSSFTDLATAERAISATFRANASAIKAWSRSAKPGSKTEFEHAFGSVVGRGVERGKTTVSNLSGVRIVLKMETYNGKPFYILTAHPIP